MTDPVIMVIYLRSISRELYYARSIPITIPDIEIEITMRAGNE